jgi:hypothetical protein
MGAYFIWYGTVANLLVSCRSIKGQVVSGIFWFTGLHPPCFGFLVHCAVRSIVLLSIIDMEIHFSLIDHYTIGDVGQAFIQADYFNEAEYQ